jgi:hypothetical protein
LLADHKLDHFKLHGVRPQEVMYKIQWQGQFDKEKPKSALLTNLVAFAAVAQKNDEKVRDKNAHFTCYKVAQRERELRRIVTIRNQFGEARLRLDQPSLILVPARKVEEGQAFPEKLDHYKCYEVVRAPAPNVKELRLGDQFGEGEAQVGPPKFFCVPAMKWYKEQEHPIKNKEDHLTLYAIRAAPSKEKTIGVVDQFDDRRVQLLQGVMLAVPTSKLDYQEERVDPNAQRPRIELRGLAAVDVRPELSVYAVDAAFFILHSSPPKTDSLTFPTRSSRKPTRSWSGPRPMILLRSIAILSFASGRPTSSR